MGTVEVTMKGKVTELSKPSEDLDLLLEQIHPKMFRKSL